MFLTCYMESPLMTKKRIKLKSREGNRPLYKTLNGLKSKRRFSRVQRVSIFPNEYAIRDYKNKTLYPIEFISRGRWKFFGKHFNKLSDINFRHIPKH